MPESVFLKNTIDLPALRANKAEQPIAIPAVVIKLQQSRKESDHHVETISTWKEIVSSSSTKSSKNLKEFLRRKSWTSAFRKFLQDECSEENLDFWNEVESYKESSLKMQPKVAQKIFEKYIAVNSPREVNIDAATRKVTMKNLNNPDSFAFNEAQNSILDLMEKDSFRRFLSKTPCERKEKSQNQPVFQLKLISQKFSFFTFTRSTKKSNNNESCSLSPENLPNVINCSSFKIRKRVFTM